MEPKKMCCICQNTFHDESNLNRHLKLVHYIKKLKTISPQHQNIECNECNKTFYDRSTLMRHLKKAHNVKSGYESINKCLECNIIFARRNSLIKHLIIMHGFKEEILEKDFPTLDDFHFWLRNLEEENKVEYIRSTGKYKSKMYTRHFYECNRSGKAPNTPFRKRSQKSQGSHKIGFNCTSHIEVKLNNVTNDVHIKYLKTHYGHDIEIEHIRLPDSAKFDIASKILSGLPVPKIVDSIRNNIGNTVNRVHLVTKKDVYNIKKSLKIDVDSVRHSNNAVKVSQGVVSGPKYPPRNVKLKNTLVNAALKLVTLANKSADEKVLSTAIQQVKATHSLLAVGDPAKTDEDEIWEETIKKESIDNKGTKQIFTSSSSTKKENKQTVEDIDELNEQVDVERVPVYAIFSKNLPNISHSIFMDHDYIAMDTLK